MRRAAAKVNAGTTPSPSKTSAQTIFHASCLSVELPCTIVVQKCFSYAVPVFLVYQKLHPAAAAMSIQGLVATAAPVSRLPNDIDWEPNLMFNEDECRDFLNEVGQVVVNSYIFSMGMEEAYTCIWRRYGLNGTSDAISLFHEMLEEDDVVGAGLGLESDIWRPWKKNFRLRNVSHKAPL